MKTPTTQILGLTLALALGSASPFVAQESESGAAATAQDETTGQDACSRWGFKKLALGMSVAAVKEQYEGVAPDPRKSEAEALGGQAYRWQHRDGAQLIDFTVLADGESDDAKVVQIKAKIRGGGITPAQWHNALLQKWGGITELRDDDPSPGRSTIEGRSIDDACDARVEFSGTGDSKEMTLDITLVSIEATRAWDLKQAEEANRNQASDLLE